eukprot:CAMPEP_0176247784 /NCGR_PEP_ID=MMETSP0121_2-20121125/33132_1 /TAXON_ID=160619 /ORGANISM="Kryptoperidinium foliaceum, Strain CCMP 1326" /LENGTH=487 /DNA_ID=CAMNT_0017587447 /DNA_START=13 /DNA_END=1471 /DNA_ORIENTATION=-
MPKVEEESLLETTDGEASEDICASCGAQLEGGHSFCPKCGEKRPSRRAIPTKRLACGCCTCCACLGICMVVIAICACVYLNQIVKIGLHAVGSALLGVDVSVEEVDVRLDQGRASMANLIVASPEGYKEDLFQLGRFDFDVAPSSLLSGWLSDFTNPVVIEDLSVFDVGVNIENKLFSTENNAQTVVSHMDQTTKSISPDLEQKVMHPELPDLQTGIKAMEVKIRVDSLKIRNISISASLPPLPAVRYVLKEVEVQDVGKKGDGVYLYEFIEIFVRALLMSVVKAAPESVQVNLASAFGEDLWKELDVGHVLFDSGKGLERIGEFAGWVSAQAALMPLKMAAMGAKIGAKSVGMGVKMNEEALKIGTELTGAMENARMKALNEQVALGAKAAEEAAKVSLAFTNGFARAFAAVGLANRRCRRICACRSAARASDGVGAVTPAWGPLAGARCLRGQGLASDPHRHSPGNSPGEVGTVDLWLAWSGCFS